MGSPPESLQRSIPALRRTKSRRDCGPAPWLDADERYARGGGESGAACEMSGGRRRRAEGASPASSGTGMSATAGRIPTAPKSAMKPASVCEQPIVGQSQSCVPCLSPCSGHTGALCVQRAVFHPRVLRTGVTRKRGGDERQSPPRATRGQSRQRSARDCVPELHDRYYLLLRQPGVEMLRLRARGAGLNCQPCPGSAASTISMLRARRRGG